MPAEENVVLDCLAQPIFQLIAVFMCLSRNARSLNPCRPRGKHSQPNQPFLQSFLPTARCCRQGVSCLRSKRRRNENIQFYALPRNPCSIIVGVCNIPLLLSCCCRSHSCLLFLAPLSGYAVAFCCPSSVSEPPLWLPQHQWRQQQQRQPLHTASVMLLSCHRPQGPRSTGVVCCSGDRAGGWQHLSLFLSFSVVPPVSFEPALGMHNLSDSNFSACTWPRRGRDI
jgi:hypothetical protein